MLIIRPISFIRLVTPKACKELGQGYAFFAYPWNVSVARNRTLKGCRGSSHGSTVRYLIRAVPRGTQKTRTPG
jgi:hypothetical protein